MPRQEPDHGERRQQEIRTETEGVQKLPQPHVGPIAGRSAAQQQHAPLVGQHQRHRKQKARQRRPREAPVTRALARGAIVHGQIPRAAHVHLGVVGEEPAVSGEWIVIRLRLVHGCTHSSHHPAGQGPGLICDPDTAHHTTTRADNACTVGSKKSFLSIGCFLGWKLGDHFPTSHVLDNCRRLHRITPSSAKVVSGFWARQ